MDLKKLKRKKNDQPLKFDKEGFFLSFGVGIVTIGIGILIIWGTLTAPEGPTNSTAFTLSQRITRLLPRSFQEWIALGLAVLFILFGIVLFILGLKTVVQYLWVKLKNKSSEKK